MPDTTDTSTPITIENWRDTLDPDIATDSTLADIKDIKDLAKGYVNAQKLIGRDKIVMPKGDDDADGWEQVYKKLGKPEKEDDYDLSVEIENFQPDKEWQASYKKKVHELGLNKKQAKAFYEHLVKDTVERQTKQIDESTRTQNSKWEEVKKAHGTEKIKQMAKSADAVLVKVLGAEGAEEFSKQGYKNSTLLFKLLSGMADLTKEGTLSYDEKPRAVMGKREALSKINAILDNKQHAYHNKKMASHEEAVKEVIRLSNIAYEGEE